MSETVCIHGIPVDPWHIHCDRCQDMPDPTPLSPGRTVDPVRLAGSWREEEQLQGDLPEETGE